MFCSVICKGPSSVALNSSYSNRDSVRFKQDMCAAVCAVAQATRGGVLVFFPSHASMKGTTDEWRKSGGYKDLESIKSVYIEPRTAQEVQQVPYGPQAHSESAALLLDLGSTQVGSCR